MSTSATGSPAQGALGATRRRPSLRRQPARPRRGRRGPDPHRRPHVPGQALHARSFPAAPRCPRRSIFAKDDSHADDIVAHRARGVRQGQRLLPEDHLPHRVPRDVEKKIGADGKEVEEVVSEEASSLSPDEILQTFRNSYFPRIAVTVDMIATGTDIKPLEIVFFMRTVRSRGASSSR